RGLSSMPADSRYPRLEVRDQGDLTVVHFPARTGLNEQNTHIIGEQLFGLVDRPGRRTLLLDLGNVEYLTSTTLGKLVALPKKLRAVGGRLLLSNLDPHVSEVLAITQLNRILEIVPADTAVSA